MSDVATASDESQVQEETVEAQQPEIKEQPFVSDEDFRKSLKEEVKTDMAKLYNEKLDIQQKQLKGLDRKNTELQRKVREYENKELTEEQKFELREKDLRDKELALYRREAMTKLPFTLEEDEKADFMSFLHGESQEEVEAAVNFFALIHDKYRKLDVEKSVQDKLSSEGYVPKSAGLNGGKGNDVYKMSRDEVVEYTKKISKMSSSPEKDALLKDLMLYQASKLKGE